MRTGKVTLKTLVERTGLSLGTVSRALKDAPEVRPETRELVKQMARQLGYTPNLGGVKLRTGKTYTLCIVLPVDTRAQDFTDSGYMALTSGIHKALQGTLYSLIVQPQLMDEDELAGLRHVVEAKVADGVILTQTRPDDVRIRYLLEQGMPFVTYGRSELHTPHAWFDTDHEDMAYRATRRLLDKGHQRIALLNPPAHLLYSRHREYGYRRALREAGLPQDPALMTASELSAADGQQLVLQLAALLDRPTAFICANEYAALGALSAFQQLGWQAGRDACLIATDDSNISAYFVPPLTTYYSSLVDAGTALGQLLLRRIAGVAAEQLQQLTCAELLERQDDCWPPQGAALSQRAGGS